MRAFKLMPLLSVCIPTYNRAKELDVLLSSLTAQDMTGVEIIVSDNASCDNTKAVVEKYGKKIKNIFYYANESNLGFDANILAAVARAKGKYCWLLGSDDALHKGALARALGYLKSNFELYAVGADLCDGSLDFLQYGGYLRRVKDGCAFGMAKKRDMLFYLSRVKANMGLFGYIGGVIFLKEIWDKIEAPQNLIGLGWIHVYKFWSFKNFGAAVKYKSRALVKIRFYNDELSLKEGRVARLILEFKGLLLTARALFKEDKDLYNAFLAAVTRYVRPDSVPPLFTLKGKDKEHWPQLVEFMRRYPYPERFKNSLNSKWRFSFIYFAREFINKPALRRVKAPVKFIKDLFFG
ncbi:MAG: glycosyltransferase family 2 protein [Elusimicrobiota bacterium]|jgi:abequosyltransferase|nr:glycosyltransferase family 2 protein [Elusimicrobiota bacterium]